MKQGKIETMKTLINEEMKNHPFFFFSYLACASVVLDVAHKNRLYLSAEQESALIDWMMNE